MPIEFAYAQARIQARCGQRLSPGAWQSLEASQGLSHYLHAVRGTSLRESVVHLNESADAHLIERSLREDWRVQVQQLGSWIPVGWRAAVLWLRTVPDLPALAHLLGGGPAYPWMRDDPVWQPVAGAEEGSRRQAMSSGELAPLGVPMDDKTSLVAAWTGQWRSLWPARPGQFPGLGELGRILAEHFRLLASEHATLVNAASGRENLERQLLKFIRRHRELPVAMFSFLGLLALDLQRLRGGLVRRALFQSVARE